MNHYVPFFLYLNISRTTADGNCLFNACSIALCGTEDLAVYLRCLTSIELYLNVLFYGSHPIFEQQHNKGAFTCIANAFSMCLSDIALACYTKDDPSESVRTEAHNTSVNHQWSSFLCVLGLSSVLRLPIESCFPIPVNQSDAQEEMDSLSTIFNCTIFPRVSSSTPDKKIHLFRCALMPAGYLNTMKIPERKNHYVALCQPRDASLEMWDIESFIPKPIFLSILQLSSTEVKKNTTVSSGITPMSLPSTSSTIPKRKLSSPSSGSVKAKMKQLVLEALFPKKRKLDEKDDEETGQSTGQKLTAGGSSSSVDTTKISNSEDSSSPSSFTKPNSQGTTLSMGTTTQPNSEESRFPNDIGNYIDRPLTEQQKYDTFATFGAHLRITHFQLIKIKGNSAMDG